TMLYFIPLTFVGLFTLPATLPVTHAVPNSAITFLGGPPSIQIAGKASGDITHAEWGSVQRVQLMGCVPSAQVVEVAVCIKDCKGKNAELRAKGDAFTGEMLSMIANLPPGTPFTITVKVVDGERKEWTVPPAHFVWKG
ncbi:MAG TPA: hypothetical protein PLV08_10300, partial [Flavobacteriales bacterium]|nr:hypothetical protein [Flavobacteriales bacterium]HQX00242.1 hypothetical protein [Flavobacteriales bacterium]HQY00154.1 hypothetical protein [Flavobacteriales bacterium]